MKKYLHYSAIFIFILLQSAFFSSCSRETAMYSQNAESLQTAQLLIQETNNENDAKAITSAENIILPKTAETQTAEIKKSENKETVANKKHISNKKISAKKIVYAFANSALPVIENGKIPMMKNATMSAQTNPNKGLTATGILFLALGLVMLIPPLALGTAGFLYIIAGILLAIGALLLLTGVAREAE